MLSKKHVRRYVAKIVADALREDKGGGDITAALIPKSKKGKAYILSRESAVICGTFFVDAVFAQLNPQIKIDWLVSDGDEVRANQILCFLRGPCCDLLTGERTALNFLQTLSAVATKTKKFVAAIDGLPVQLLDTRKTIPGLRMAQKYAVSCGGGKNHRFGLFDAFLIKENHIAALGGSIAKAVRAARKTHPGKVVEIEVRNLAEFKTALACKPDIILLDNFNLRAVRKAVEIRCEPLKLEISGGIDLSNIRDMAETGVDFISIGTLTKDIKAVDLSMLFEDYGAAINS